MAEWDRRWLAQLEVERVRAETEAEEWRGRLAEIRGERAAGLKAAADAAAERVAQAAAERITALERDWQACLGAAEATAEEARRAIEGER